MGVSVFLLDPELLEGSKGHALVMTCHSHTVDTQPVLVKDTLSLTWLLPLGPDAPPPTRHTHTHTVAVL